MTTDQRIENLEKGLASARRFNRRLLATVGLALGVWILAGTFGPTMAAAPAGGGAFPSAYSSDSAACRSVKNASLRGWFTALSGSANTNA